jgi:tetratricopeptide (TPR) repeat protein
MVSANYEAYKSVMRQAYRDGQITPEETAVLDTLRQSLNISADEHSQAEAEVKQEIENGGLQDGGSMASNDPVPAPAMDDDVNVIRPGNNPSDFSSDNNPDVALDNPVDLGVPPSEDLDMGGDMPAATNGPQNLDEFLNEGKGAYKKGDFQQAIVYFDKAIEMEPDNSEAIFYRRRSQKKLEETGGGAAAGPAGAAAPGAAPAGAEGGPAAGGPTPPSPIPASEMRGDPNCSSCSGAGTCRWCKASGGCYWCKGSGQCDKCKGTGVTKGQQCGSCAGSGKCHSCKGTGLCYWCQGKGTCNKCSV